MCVGEGKFDAVEMGCVDVPLAALGDNSQWFGSPGAGDSLLHLLTLQHCAAVSPGIECSV